MHPTSSENMRSMLVRYVFGPFVETRQPVKVLDVGAADVNGSYKGLFPSATFEYLGADLTPGPNVDVLLSDPYVLPFSDRAFDLIVSGQMLEHCEFFWTTFSEMARVLKPDGLIILIAPSAGPIHRYPVDCYRFYPDAYRALAKMAGLTLLECRLDSRGPWCDLTGVFARGGGPAVTDAEEDTWSASQSAKRGLPEEEVRQGELEYLDMLSRLHDTLAPRNYLEIGVRFGGSLSRATAPSVAVDPDPLLDLVPERTVLFQMTSDRFFEREAAAALTQPIDLVFIDGMHLFEYVYRDFMNVERWAHSGTLVVIDDIFPNHPAQAARVRRTSSWCGDVWKLADCIRRHRPDLITVPVNTYPTGLLLVAGLDRENRELERNYNPIVRHYMQLDSVPPAGVLARRGALNPDSPTIASLATELRRLRETDANAQSVQRRLRTLLAPVR